MSNVEQFYGVNFNEFVKQALLWQYNKATGLQGLVNDKENYIVHVNNLFWCWFFFNYFYLPEADDDGIVIWSILLNYGISASQSGEDDDVWGFGDDDEQFDQAPFTTGEHETVSLPLAYSRIVLRMRYFNLTTSGTVTQINAFYRYLFDSIGWTDKEMVVVDNHDMTITYRLNFTPDIYFRFILDNLDMLARPAGVEVNWETFTGDYWGFGEDDEQFDQASYYP